MRQSALTGSPGPTHVKAPSQSDRPRINIAKPGHIYIRQLLKLRRTARGTVHPSYVSSLCCECYQTEQASALANRFNRTRRSRAGSITKQSTGNAKLPARFRKQKSLIRANRAIRGSALTQDGAGRRLGQEPRRVCARGPATPSQILANNAGEPRLRDSRVCVLSIAIYYI